MKCPYCQAEMTCDTVDVGVGYVQCGPYCCDSCGASEIGPERYTEITDTKTFKVLDHIDNSEKLGLDPDEKRTGFYKNRISPLANQKDGKVISHQEADAIYREEYFKENGNPYNAPVDRFAPPKEEDPHQSEEYQKFVESMAQHCRCAKDRPCDGVLAGGICDDIQDDEDLFEDEDDTFKD